MAGFGSGLAHALTAGLTGYREGQDEQQKKLIILAAQQRAEQRQKQQDELARISALTNAANAGLEIGDAPAPVQAGVPAVAVPDTASVRAVKGQNPESPEGGAANPAPATPSQDGTVIGAVGGRSIKIPAGGVIGKAARDDAAKQAQRTADLLKRAQPLNSRLPDGHPFKLSDDQLAGVAADPQLYNEWARGALGITKDPVAMHKAMRDYDVAHPTKNIGVGDSGPGVWVQNPDDPTGPAVYVPRSQAFGQKAPTHAANSRSTVAMQKAVAANQTQLSIIDDALNELGQHPNAVGLSRYAGDAINQRVDSAGVGTRASIANIGSMIVHDRSGAAVTVSEYPRLAPFVPKVTDSPHAIRDKLGKLKNAIQTETSALQSQSGGQNAGAPTNGTTDGSGAPTQGGKTVTVNGKTFHLPE